MSTRSVQKQHNLVQHTWPIDSDDVIVQLTVRSRDPLLPEAYSAIRDVVVAGDKLAELLYELGVRKVMGEVESTVVP